MAFLHLPPIRWLTSFYNPPIQKNIFLLTQIKNFDLNLLKEFKRKLDLYYNALKKNNNTSHSILLKAFLYKYMANIIFKIKSSRGML